MPTTTLTQPSPEVELPPDSVTTEDHRNPRRRRRDPEPETPPVGDLVFPDHRHDLDKLILHPEVKTDILAGLRALEIRADLDRIWNLSAIKPQQGRCILNFYGPPGTGKTRCCSSMKPTAFCQSAWPQASPAPPASTRTATR